MLWLSSRTYGIQTDVLNVIKALKSGYSAGLDSIPYFTVKATIIPTNKSGKINVVHNIIDVYQS